VADKACRHDAVLLVQHVGQADLRMRPHALGIRSHCRTPQVRRTSFNKECIGYNKQVHCYFSFATVRCTVCLNIPMWPRVVCACLDGG
jgi:hypothetical protein